jgi:hypothetical protein
MCQLTATTSVRSLSDGSIIPPEPTLGAWQEYQDWLAAGNTPLPADAPSADQVKQQLQAFVQQALLDATAQSMGYDDIRTAVTYADEPAVPRFRAEGTALRAWRSLTWSACYDILAAVEAGTRPVPTEAELLAELPAFLPPPPAAVEG